MTKQVVSDSLGRELALRLDALAQAHTAPDIAERLRFSRERALARARQIAMQPIGSAVVQQGRVAGLAWAGANASQSGTGFGGDETPAWWMKWASVLPLVVLVLGFILVQDLLSRADVHAAAEIDAALLVDDLPPAAYSDPGFAEFLRSRQP